MCYICNDYFIMTKQQPSFAKRALYAFVMIFDQDNKDIPIKELGEYYYQSLGCRDDFKHDL